MPGLCLSGSFEPLIPELVLYDIRKLLSGKGNKRAAVLKGQRFLSWPVIFGMQDRGFLPACRGTSNREAYSFRRVDRHFMVSRADGVQSPLLTIADASVSESGVE
jgi:hypothetical protein